MSEHCDDLRGREDYLLSQTQLDDDLIHKSAWWNRRYQVGGVGPIYGGSMEDMPDIHDRGKGVPDAIISDFISFVQHTCGYDI